MNFLGRQRKAVDFSDKFVISDQDIIRSREAYQRCTPRTIERRVFPVAKMLDGFEPVEDALDRRLFYEVSGLKLNQDEFKSEDSYDESDDTQEQPNRQASDSRVEAVSFMLNSDSDYDSDRESLDDDQGNDDKEDIVVRANSDQNLADDEKDARTGRKPKDK